MCVDDVSRAAYSLILPDERTKSVVEFLWYAVACDVSHGIRVKVYLRIMKLVTRLGNSEKPAESSA